MDKIRHNFGLTKNELEILRELVIPPLLKAGASVWIFGSRARGDHKKHSDIDVLYDFSPERPKPRGLIFDIATNVEESRLPIKVDLVALNELAESYRENVLTDRIVLNEDTK